MKNKSNFALKSTFYLKYLPERPYISCDGAKNPDDLRRFLYLAQLKEISQAVESGDISRLLTLFDEGYASKTMLIGDHNKTLLHIAAQYNQTEIAEYLVKEAPELLISQDRTGRTPKTYATLMRHHRLAKLLKNATNKLPKGKYFFASRSYSIAGKDKLNKLIAQTIDFILNDFKNRNFIDVKVTKIPENENTGFGPIFQCSEHKENQFMHGEVKIGETRIAFKKPLLPNEEVYQLNNLASKNGALKNAQTGNLVGIEASLVEFELNKDTQNEIGETPLHLASKFGHFDVVKYLVNMKASLVIVTKDGKNAYEYAIENGHAKIASFLKNEKLEKIMTALKREFLPPDLFGPSIDPNKYDKMIGNMNHFESMVSHFIYVPGAYENLLKVVNFGKKMSSNLHIAKGAFYELEVAEVLALRGETIEGFGLKYHNKNNQQSQIENEFDLQTSTKLIEVKNICWTAVEDEENLKTFFLIHRDIANQGSRNFEFHSKQPIPESWKKWFISENIPAFETQLPSID